MVSKIVKIISAVALVGAVGAVAYTKGCNKPTIHVSVDRNHNPQDSSDALGSDAYSPSPDATSTVLSQDANSIETLILATDSTIPSTTLPTDITQVVLLTPVTSTSLPKDATSTSAACQNELYCNIKLVLENSKYSNEKKQDSLSSMINDYVKQHGPMIIAFNPADLNKKTMTQKQLCASMYNQAYTNMVGPIQTALDTKTQDSFTALLATYCPKTIVVDPKNPIVRIQYHK